MPRDAYDYTGPPPTQEFEPNTLVIADQSLRLGFIQLPKLVLYARNLTRDAKLLYAILLGYAWQQGSCFPGYGRLCYDMGASENTVRGYMRELEQVGLLTYRRRGLGKTNIYTLLDLRTSKIEVQEPQAARSAKTEVLEPTKTAVAEHKKTAGEIETEEVETDQQYTDIISNDINTAFPNSNRSYAQLSTSLRRQSNVDNPPPVETPADGTDAPPAPTGGEDAEPAEPTGLVAMRELVAGWKQEHPAVAGHNHGNGRGRPPKAPYIEQVMAEFSSLVLNDPEHTRQNVSQAAKLWRASGLDEQRFVQDVLYQARSLTQAQGNIQKRAADGSGRRNKAPYFFAVVRDLIGLKDQPASRDAAVPAAPTGGQR